jgi:predicted O-methyltransferase YrrM
MKNSELISEEDIVRYHQGLFCKTDSILEAIIADAKERDLYKMQFTHYECEFIQMILSLAGASIGVELGTLLGLCSIRIARVLPDSGRLYSVEPNGELAEEAYRNLLKAGVAEKVTLIHANTRDILESSQLPTELDFCIIDAKWRDYDFYLDWALRNVRLGGLIIAHDINLSGFIAHNPDDPSFELGLFEEGRETLASYLNSSENYKAEFQENLRAMRQFNQKLADNNKLKSIIFPSFNGLSVSRVTER